MDNPDVELDSVVDMVIPVLDTEDVRVVSTADAVGYVPLGGLSSIGEAVRSDPSGTGSSGQRPSDRVDRAASSLGDVDVRAGSSTAGSSTSSFVVVSPEFRVDSAASSLSDPDV